jgi:hypothetical protein
VESLPLVLRYVASCEVGLPSEIELSALGDFPTRTRTLSGDTRGDGLDGVPLSAVELAVRTTNVRGVAVGRRVRARGAGEQALLLIPQGPSCPSGEPYLRMSDGAAAVALPGGGFFLAGGSVSEAFGASAAFLVGEGSELATEVNGGMLLGRAYASATAQGDWVVVAGGTADRRARAHDTFEIFDRQLGQFIAARSGKLQSARMQHGAVALADAQLLLVGGRQEAEAEPLLTAELLDPVGGASQLLDVEHGPRVGRLQPELLVLDSGSVLVVGGRDAGGRSLGSIERYEPESQHFTLIAEDLPARDQVAVAALPGARLAWLACDHAPRGGGALCELELLAERDGTLARSPVELPSLREDASNGLTGLRLVDMGTGELLLTAADDSDPTGRRRAFTIDPIAKRATRIDATRVPLRLLRLSNGVLVELDETGFSLRAPRSFGRFASPTEDLVTDDRQYLALDAPGRWLWQEQGARALVAGARVDLPELRFAAFRAEIDVQGNFEVLMYDGSGQELRVSARDGEVEVGACRAPLAAGERLSLLRVRDTLVVAGTSCSVPMFAGPSGIGLRLEHDAVLSHLTVARL